MKRLCEIVDVGVNNENCVVFKVKDNAVMDLIALGCFKGDEDMIRMTKGRSPEITIFKKDGSSFSYHFGEGGSTLISDNTKQQREMIRECAILDYGIVCDWSYMPKDVDYKGLVQDTTNVKSMEDARRTVTLVSGGGMAGHIRINGQHVASDVHVKDIANWFKERGYEVDFNASIERDGLPCGKVYGYCEPISSGEKKFEDGDVSKETDINEKIYTPYGKQLMETWCNFAHKDVDNGTFDGTYKYEDKIHTAEDAAGWCLLTYDEDAITTVCEWANENNTTKVWDIDIKDILAILNRCFVNPPEVALNVQDISKERYDVLLYNAVVLCTEGLTDNYQVYDVLYNEIGMTDEEIKFIGFGDCVPQRLEDVVKNSKEKAQQVNNESKSVENNGFDEKDF